MPRQSRIRTVVLTVQYAVRSSYYEDWLDAFEASPLFAITAFNLFRRSERRAAMDAVANAELIVALHACSADTLDFILPLREALKARRGRFLMLVGNEYNLPWVRLADKRQFLSEVGADWVGTQLPLEAGEWLYEGTGAAVIALPHAVNEAVFRRDRRDEVRAIDIGGRSFPYPVYIGDQDRNRVYEVFAEIGPAMGLRTDIAMNARFDRPGWAAFLNDCRATIGTEAGTRYLERDDRTTLAIRDFLRDRARGPTIRADGWLHAAVRHLPFGVKDQLKALLARSPIRHEALSDVAFDELEARFFAGPTSCPVYSKCISSRHFEAAATGTCQLLMRGRYNDILEADQHYIPLAPDLGDISTAIERFRDPGERQRIADAAFELVQEYHTYRHRLEALHDNVLAG
jgi:hypothetical protein